ncbi:hypothetical protein ABEB36_010318 [Hypothenemus hampei]|uniref:Nuclear cap-binding protein subunit 3 n=1 Tax=Hypothenemus hampei TaxID=57062 RepID=A0ABD1EJE2_HYPHA
MSASTEDFRPNIRIQISNDPKNSEETMDVDMEGNGNEEGEISDDNMNEENIQEDPSKNTGSSAVSTTFTTGSYIFDTNTQEKLQERAKRFALKPEEIHGFSEQNLKNLYDSLGVNSTNERDIKFDTVHILGLQDMTPYDIVEYFAGYAPEAIEWIDDNSCSLVFIDDMGAARALHFKSKAVKGMPARESTNLLPKEFLDIEDEPEPNTGQSILLRNQNREVELQNEIGEVILPVKKAYLENAVDISEITIPIPPGYWRLGNPHPKSKCMLVRFGKLSDKLPFKVEKCNKYFNTPLQINKNFISDDRKKGLRSIFERNREFSQGKNPWATLAKNWDHDSKFREREPIRHESPTEDVEIIELKNPALKARLGTKRKLDSKEIELEEPTEPELNKPLKKTTKVPRMKMYADEEEENQKRKNILKTIKKQTEEIERRENEGDLRDMLGPNNRLLMKSDLSKEREVDLALKLKNRSRKMVFAVDRDLHEYHDMVSSRPPVYPDARRDLIERNHRHTREEPSKDAREKLSKDDTYLERSSRSSRRRTLERTLHSDRMQASRSHKTHRRHRSRTPTTKPRSKVAVVVREIKKPVVASTIWSKVTKSGVSEESSSGSESESEESSSSSSSSSSDSEESEASHSSTGKRIPIKNLDRPGFDKSRLSTGMTYKSPLKITTSNEHFGRNRFKKF